MNQYPDLCPIRVCGNVFIDEHGKEHTIVDGFECFRMSKTCFRRTVDNRPFYKTDHMYNCPFYKTIVPIRVYKKTIYIDQKKNSNEKVIYAVITEMIIPPESIFYNPGHDCKINESKKRANRAFVIKHIGLYNNSEYVETCSRYDNNFLYKINTLVTPTESYFDKYDWERGGFKQAVCESGIHFFWTRKSAGDYDFM